MRLQFLNRHKIDKQIKEPSGLALGADGKSLWTVSDSQRRLFEMDLRGKLLRSIPVNNKGLEGITRVAASDRFFVVDEDSSRIIGISTQGEELDSHRLDGLRGFDPLKTAFAESENKGLEGIAFAESRDCFYLLKEGEPGLLMEVTSDLKAIAQVTILDKQRGFVDDDLSPGKIDFSGLSYDPQRDGLWITSDQARRLYFFNLNEGCVEASFALEYRKGEKSKTISKVEGVVMDAQNSLLYLASDHERRLYVFAIH